MKHRFLSPALNRAGVVGLAVAALALAGGLAVRQANGGPAHGQTVAVVIDYGNGVKKLYTAVPWRKDMTVLDAMNEAKAAKPSLDFAHSGKGETVFITAMDGFENQGGEKEARNWIYFVNGEFIKKSAGIAELGVNDVVIWRFDTWKPGQ